MLIHPLAFISSPHSFVAMDQQSFDESRQARANTYAFDGQMLIIAAIAAVFLFVVLLVTLHLYARWWLRNGAASGRTDVFVIADNRHADSTADHRLEPHVLSLLPVFTYSSQTTSLKHEQVLLECAVCLCDFEENEVGRLLPKCNHSFHVECIDMWFDSHSTCPLCRSLVDDSASDQPEPSLVVVVEVGEEISRPEPGSSSGFGLCGTCQHEEGCENVGEESTASLARRRKAVSVKINVAQPKIDNESTQGSPTIRMSSFKRLLSMGGMSPSASRMTPRYSKSSSAELDLEGGLREPIRVHTPK